MEEARLSRQLEKIANHLKLVLADVEELAQEINSINTSHLMERRVSPLDPPQPEVDTSDIPRVTEITPRKKRTRTDYHISVQQLRGVNLLKPRERLVLTRYDQTANAYVTETGGIEWDGTVYDNPSQAAGQAAQSIGGPLEQNGWTTWKLSRTGQSLAEVREEYLNKYT